MFPKWLRKQSLEMGIWNRVYRCNDRGKTPWLVTNNTGTITDREEHCDYTGWMVEDWEGAGGYKPLVS